MQFVAIDFETANHRSDSACQLAAVVVEQGVIVGEHCWLIKPRPLFFSSTCVRIHGITPEQVADSPEWDEAWGMIHPILRDRVLIAHNAGFDLRVLRDTLGSFDLACPNVDYQCTRLIARRAWPGRSGYGLKPTADALGLSFRHHDALEDARVCAKIALAAASKVSASSLEMLEETLGLIRGRFQFGSLIGPRSKKVSRKTRLEEGPIESRKYRRDGWPDSSASSRQRFHLAEAILERASHSHPLVGKHVVLQGSLLGLERPHAIAFLERLGAIVQSKIGLGTDFMIAGHPCSEEVAVPEANGAEDQPKESVAKVQEEAIAKRNREGVPIRILSQRQLLAMLPGGLEITRNASGLAR